MNSCTTEGTLMKNYYKIILSLTILSLMRVGWGQSMVDSGDTSFFEDGTTESSFKSLMNENYKSEINKQGKEYSQQNREIINVAILRSWGSSGPEGFTYWDDYNTSWNEWGEYQLIIDRETFNGAFDYDLLNQHCLLVN